ncbi:PP2C family protein-serine/threonine phosphatase [Synechococcus sp. PCC 7336]|uniref:PP2C family protein-serine/threonine phosphatase n=1 Tax=Synechococcus sp. PCC 7336 TaxID=195250 RepID=UPI000345CE6A|nr:SpoIIE family protein phosphatase [Synechococcus sp. PCC 7336]
MNQILVIDDDITIQLTLQRILEKQGYEVAIANNGEAGIEMAIALQPAVIICDWMMPGLKGPDVCRRVKERPELSSSFFILLTAFDSVDQLVRGLDAGADDFLTKPTERAELQARIRAGVRSYELKRQLRLQAEQIEAELAEAASYVRSLLPEPLTGPISTDWKFLPSAQLGGDSFHCFWLTDDCLAIYLLDVSGHGVGAALLSATLMNVLRSQSLPETDFQQPEQVLRSLNGRFRMGDQNDKYFTIWYGVYRPHSRQLVYGSAGHPPAILIEDGKSARQLQTPAVAAGMFENSEYVQQECSIAAGSTLYLFSDGIYEEIDTDRNELWGLENFIQFLQATHQNCGDRAEQVIPSVLNRVRQLRGKSRFIDDVSLLQVVFR